MKLEEIENQLASESNYGDKKPRAVVKRFSDIKSVPISWLWPERIALGKLTLIVGDPNLGKSLITATMAAVVSKGYAWPVDKTSAPVGDVIFLSAEDDAADTTKPRLEAAAADCARIHLLQAVRVENTEGEQVEQMFSLKRDLEALEEMIRSLPECKLIIIDPISAYLGETDSHKNAAVRGLLAPLAALAAKYGIAVLAIDHLNKNSGESNALYRPGGSLAFVAAARAVYIVVRDKENPNRRLMMPIKNNVAKENTGFAYTVVTAENGQPVIAWETEPVEMTAMEALVQPDAKEERTDIDWASSVLQDILADGPKTVAEVNKEARAAGVKDKPLRTARERLGVKTTKSGFGGGWVLALPEHEGALRREDAPSKTEGTLGDGGHVRSKEILEDG